MPNRTCIIVAATLALIAPLAMAEEPPTQLPDSASVEILSELWGEAPAVRLVRLYYERDPQVVVGSLHEFGALFTPRSLVIPVSGRISEAAMTRQLQQALSELRSRLQVEPMDAPPDAFDGGDGPQMQEALDAINQDLARELLTMMRVFGAGQQRPLLLVFGPRSEVDMIERVVAAVDVPQPEVRLDIWAFQLSGGSARKVSARSREAREYIRVTARLMEDWLKQLEAVALEELERNQRLYNDMHAEAETAEDAADALEQIADAAAQGPEVKFTPWDTPSGMLALPSKRGLHPLSVTEMLSVLLMANPGMLGDWRGFVGMMVEERMADWGDDLFERDPKAAELWLELLEAQDEPLRPGLADLVRSGLGRSELEGEPTLAPVMPRRLLDTFRDPVYHRAARGAVVNLIRARQDGRDGAVALPPRDARLLAANGRTVLHAAGRALSDDIYELFLAPLLSKLHETAGTGTRTGRGVASNTSITVVSDELGLVQSRSVSYFDVSRPEWEFDVAPKEGSGLQPAESDGYQSGSAAAPASASQQLDDLVDQWGVNVKHNAQVWEVLTDGSVLGFVPHVLPGGSTADIEIELLVGRNNPRIYPPGGNPASTPLDSVAMHRTHTSVYVDSLDLFGLSSLSLTTSHPRPDYEVPVLGSVPIIGDMFTFDRGPQSVHHESIMLVYATILPTGSDLAELLDFEPVADE
ncbi:MAG: hypothetical protein GF393_00720 [Armatimonadia bacterium]|nr:hypothetical protein [Armatimonadia bacterium]